MKKIFWIFIFSCIPFFLIAQEDRINDLMKKGNEYLIDWKLEAAKKIYEKVLKKKTDFPPALRGMATVYELQDNYEEAENYLKKIIEKNPYFSRVIYYDLGKVYYRQGKYTEAIEAFEKFKYLLDLPPSKFGYNVTMEQGIEFKYKKQLDDSIFECVYARDSIPALGIKDVKNLGDSINTPMNDYFPFLTNDESVLLFTRVNIMNEDFYVSFFEDGKWRKGKKVGGGFNTGNNEGMCTCTRDNIRLYFTACKRENVNGTCDIQQAILEIGENQNIKIKNIEVLQGEVNSKYWESQASISCDGSMMFYTSSRKGYGKTDIYVSKLQADGSWSKGENLGPNINTNDYEESPFITNDGNTLFFSSTGLLGMGEQDIYMSRKQKDGSWGRPMNLGNQINTAGRELGFFLSADGRTGYFASDRKGGKGKLDIYQFTLSVPIKSDPITFVEGFVKDSITKEPIQTVVEFSDGQKMATDENGRFFRCLPPNNYHIKINEKEYIPFHENKIIPEWDNRTFFPLELLLKKEDNKIIVENIPKDNPPKKDTTIKINKIITAPYMQPFQTSIYFDFDKYNLSETAKGKINEIQNKIGRSILKGTRVYSKIQIKAYCDFKGTKKYNLQLAEKRAKETFEYLIKRGLPPEKIEIQSIGEINNNDPRWMNRRVDIFIVP